MQLHTYVRSEWRFGYAEAGESCRACNRRLFLNESCLVLRLRHHELQQYGPPAGFLCHLDALRQGIKPGSEGGTLGRLEGDLETLQRQFWAGLRNTRGEPTPWPKRLF
jgi:hypothetical protein